MAQTPAIIPLPAGAIGAAGAVLGRAFMDDPLFVWAAPDERRRARFLTSCMTTFVRYALPLGETYTTEGGVVGAALWLPPGRTRVARVAMLRAGIIGALLQLGARGSIRFAAAGSALEAAHERALPGPHWYLMDLAVDPPRQGQGIGGALIEPVLARADAGRLPVYLETQAERNLAFYGKRGFALVSEGDFSRSGPHFWTMRREPKT